MRWLALLVVSACAHVPTDVEQQKACQHELDGGTLLLVLSPVHCGGTTPGHGWNLVVVPRDIPPISTVRCSIGRCPDRDLPPA
jgi:hypothetical protein